MKNTGLLIVLALLAAGAAIGLFGARSFLKTAPEPGLSSSQDGAPPVLPPHLPALEESDGYVRGRAAGLSAAPSFAEWLKQEYLIQRLAAAMSMIADGKLPRETFAAFAPKGKFRVLKKDGRTVIDPAGYARYDVFAAMVAGVDAVAAARVFEDLLPLLDIAQRELGERNITGARATLRAAAEELLAAPPLEGDVALIEGKKGLGWAYADAGLEARSPAQKQLMRMGPKNQAAVQAKLRAMTLALGAPAAAR